MLRLMEPPLREAEYERALTATGERLLGWLFSDVLPLWSRAGRAPVGWHDSLGRDLRPTADPLRMRVQARQVYAFAEAGRLGWTGPWRDALEHGLDFLVRHATRPDGLAAHTFAPDGGVIEAGPDLYDQAFTLFAYAAAFGATRDGRALAGARRLRDALAPYAHRSGGYRELAGPLLRANPQMHTLEAVLLWAAYDDDPCWMELARSLARLCAERLTDPATDALHEVFVGDWTPAPGQTGECTEPGHHFEWAWLIDREELATPPGLALRLCERAERVGVDRNRKVAVNAVSADGTVVDAKARLWPQTERLKAALAMRPHDPAVWTGRAVESAETILAYAAPMPPGLWLDVMSADGTLAEEAAPASSLYHVTCAVSELARAAGLVRPRW